MKKLLVIIATLVLAMSCAMLVACGGVEGKYYAKSITANGQTVEVSGDEAKSYLKLGSDNKLYASEDGSTEEEIGTWKKADEGEDAYVLTFVLVDVDATISGGKLVYKMSGAEYVFEK